MIIDSLRLSKRFIVTENREKADLILKGSALEKDSQKIHAAASSTVAAGRTGTLGRAIGIGDSEFSTETVSEAKLAVRLVSSHGDVVWSATEESKGGKYSELSAGVRNIRNCYLSLRDNACNSIRRWFHCLAAGREEKAHGPAASGRRDRRPGSARCSALGWLVAQLFEEGGHIPIVAAPSNVPVFKFEDSRAAN